MFKGNYDILSRAFAGISTSAAGITISILHQLETILRICSLVVGISVGLVTLYGIITRLRQDRKQKTVDQKPKL